MVKNDIRPYEISLWTLQDSFISVLKPYDIVRKGNIETPKCHFKDDGTQELSFTIPMYYREDGILIENPIWYNVINGSLIANLRKLKLIFNKGEKGKERIFEFVISKVLETHSDGQLKCEITAEGLAFQELGKIGYKISLKSQDFIDEYNEWVESGKEGEEPINNIDYWCEKIFKNSRWTHEVRMNWAAYDGVTKILNNEERKTAGLRRTDKIYEEEYISSWDYNEQADSLVPNKMENFSEKLRLVDLEKSNIYNLTQDLAKAFGVFCKYEYEYDDNYHIIGRKCIFYNNFISEAEGRIDIVYPFDAKKIEREIDSADVVTKMFVTPVEDNTSPSGLITIADVSANKSREDYILNFDYLYNIGTISQEQYDEIEVYERSMFLKNSEITPLAMQIANLQNDLVKYEAQLTIAKESQILDKEQMEQSLALFNSITKNANRLYKNLDNPHRGVLLSSEKNSEGQQTYQIKMTTEGIIGYDKEQEYGYPKNEGDMENIYGIHLWYKIKADASDTISYAEETNFEINCDDNGNVTSLSNIIYDETKAISKNYVVTFAYIPQLQHENVYNTYAKKLAEDENSEKEAVQKIEEIKSKIEKIEERYNTLLEEKKILIADFENMMGPALKEGSWQAESYSDYGSKFSQEIEIGITNNSYANFKWDEEAFEEEQLLYDEVGVDLPKFYYPCIDIQDKLSSIIPNLEKLSFIYPEGQSFGQMTYGAELQLAFIKDDMSGKPVLLLTDKDFTLTDDLKVSGYLGIITSTIENDEVKTNIEKIIPEGSLTWIALDDNSVMVYPRIEIASLLLKTSEDELNISINDLLLENYYDYSVLVRGESYFITFKNDVILNEEGIVSAINIDYALSNAALSLYLDSLEVSKTNAFPQVSYKIEVSILNENFMKHAYDNLSRIVDINDHDLKFDNVQGYISELDLSLENPWEDEITVQNYKTKFEDLFSTIVASSEQMKVNSFSYNNAASAFGAGGSLKSSVIQNAITQTDLTYAFQSGNLTIDELNGIWARSDAGVVAMRGGGIFCATQTDSNGNWLWNTGIMPSGINASLITAGQIDTNLIKIYAGDNLRLQLNADGLFAYAQDLGGEANLNQYVVHNSDGLFLIQPKVDNDGNKLDELIKKVEISWDGLIIRNNQGDKIFYANEKGDLSISGTITARDGNIGKWIISEDGLVSGDNNAGIITKVEVDDEGKIISGSELYTMLWVQGQENKKFEVTSDATVYANNVILSGFISAESIIGNLEGQEISNQLKNLEILILDGTTFIFSNRNYDNNLITEPDWLYFRIKTNALTEEELTNSNYEFYYGIPKEGELEPSEWYKFSSENGVYDENYLIWKPDYLTFILKSDIMYLGLEESSTPNNSVFVKIEKQGFLKVSNPETGDLSCDTEHTYSAIVQINSEKHGIGKFVSQVTPPSYSFVEDKNLGIDYAKEIVFSATLTGFDLINDKEELENSTWLINGVDKQLRAKLVSSDIELENGTSGAAVIASEDDSLIINGEEVEEPYWNEEEERTIYTNIDGNSEVGTDGIEIFLTPEEDGSITASAVVSKDAVPEGGNISLTFKISEATRNAFCFKTRNGSDGINIVMRSSSGYTLTSGDIDTELSVDIYYGMNQMNAEGSETQFYYVWKKDDVALSAFEVKETFQKNNEDNELIEDNTTKKYKVISEQDNDLKIGMVLADFFKQKSIYITAKDFGLKSIYRCDVFTTLEDAKEEYKLNNKNEDQELYIIEPFIME